MIKDLKIAFKEEKKINANLDFTKNILTKYQDISKFGGSNHDTSSLITLLTK